jgi:PmbA protein
MQGGVLPKLASKITIAGNLKQIFLNLTAANDLVFRRGTDCPTLRIEGLTLAGA